MCGLFPPSSMVAGTMFSDAYCRMSRPVVVSPVKDTFRIPGWLARGAPASGPYPVTTFRTPGGRTSRRSLASSRRVRGVCSAGFITTVFPAASEGASFHAASRSGKFHGRMCPTTPSGSRRVRCSMFGSMDWVSPWMFRSTPAKYR